MRGPGLGHPRLGPWPRGAAPMPPLAGQQCTSSWSIRGWLAKAAGAGPGAATGTGRAMRPGGPQAIELAASGPGRPRVCNEGALAT